MGSFTFGIPNCYLQKGNPMKKYTTIKTLFVLAILVTTIQTTFAQDLFCERPQYAPRKEHHQNCKDYLGRRQGVWKFYSYYGYVLGEMNYKDNKLNGPVVSYFAVTGKVRERSNYFDGKKDGEFSSYFFSGQTASEGEYDYGKKIGTWAYYYNSTGEMKMTGTYSAGKRNGDWKYYSSKGVLGKTVTYKNGEAVKTTVPVKETLANNASN